jgi:hypothetical protein
MAMPTAVYANPFVISANPFVISAYPFVISANLSRHDETPRRVETYAGHTCVYTVAPKRREALILILTPIPSLLYERLRQRDAARM